MKQCWLLDEHNVWTGKVRWEQNPPQNAACEEPPELAEGESAHWNGVSWDAPGVNTMGRWWHKTTGAITDINTWGDSAPANSIQVQPPVAEEDVDGAYYFNDDPQVMAWEKVPPPERTLAVAKTEKKNAINLYYDELRGANYTFQTNPYKADDRSRKEMSEVVTNVIAQSLTTVTWSDANNVDQTLSADDFKTLYNDIIERSQGYTRTRTTKYGEVDALLTIEAVDSYDETAGW